MHSTSAAFPGPQTRCQTSERSSGQDDETLPPEKSMLNNSTSKNDNQIHAIWSPGLYWSAKAILAFCIITPITRTSSNRSRDPTKNSIILLIKQTTRMLGFYVAKQQCSTIHARGLQGTGNGGNTVVTAVMWQNPMKNAKMSMIQITWFSDKKIWFKLANPGNDIMFICTYLLVYIYINVMLFDVDCRN